MNGIKVFFIIVLTVIAIWLGIHIEMWLYENIVINAMGAPLNKLSFWEMFGFDFLCGMLTGKVSVNNKNKKEN